MQENHTSFTTRLWCTLANKISSEERGIWSLSNSFCLHTFRRVQFWQWTCVLCIMQSSSAEQALKFITVLEGGERRSHILVHNIKRGCSFRKHTEAKHDWQWEKRSWNPSLVGITQPCGILYGGSEKGAKMSSLLADWIGKIRKKRGVKKKKRQRAAFCHTGL